ncbi:MAG: TAXI family TRAP transporter solute-binding subunit [Pirellulaceae bacterium]|jgi:TRAP transporter TAXI family solute receptor|nr:TAXI family TRAP transporter solute-binding subunit [Pirellulaceae bacterium]
MRRPWIKVVVVVVLILLPVGIGWFGQDMIQGLYRKKTGYPKTITIAAGSEGGRYRVISESLKNEIEEKLGVEVVVRPTAGSLANLLCLRTGDADFALYQPGTIDLLRQHDRGLVEEAEAAVGLESPTEGEDHVAFVANLYMQPVQFIVRHDANIEQSSDLRLRSDGKRRQVSVGLPQSGDYAMSLVILEHLGLDEDEIELKHLTYERIVDGLLGNDLDEHKTLDAAFNTMGAPAPVLRELFDTGQCDILEIPYTEALTMKHVFLSEFTIPAGLLDSQTPAKPANDVKTVAIPAQLLTRKDLNSHFVQELTGIVLDKHFARRNDLHRLLDGGQKFAQATPDFAVHQGAQSVYDPEFDIQMVESWEAAYSLSLSIVIAVFFGFQWLRRWRVRTTEHKLDQYIRSLLDIEGQQVGLDEGADASDLERLQQLLDELTFLRQRALREFSVHDLNEDRGVDCFIVMCHELSNKVNAKISRQRLDTVMNRLIEATTSGAASAKNHSATATEPGASTAQE